MVEFGVKSKEREVRRKEILDTAEGFFSEKGYEATSVQDLIDAIGTAKGTFYHYFQSKEDLLDANAMVERMLGNTVQSTTRAVVDDARLTAPEKPARLFSGGYSGTHLPRGAS